MRALARNWWLMAVRGGLAIAFGLAVLMWQEITLSVVVVMFGVYAVLDGLCAVTAALRAGRPRAEAWPVLLEGAVSVGLGLLALGWPTVPRELVYLVAAWGVGTGALELVAAGGVARSRPAHWLLMTGGASSVFLALLLLLVPHAGVDLVVRIIAAYAQVFGVVMLLAAAAFPERRLVDREARP